MLEIICAASLALSINLNDSLGSNIVSPDEIEISQLNSVYLAKGKPQESRYRREADRVRERYDRQNRSNEGRIYRDSDAYRREVEYRQNRRDRVYQNRDRYDREEEYDRNRRDRYYRGESYKDEYFRRNRHYRY